MYYFMIISMFFGALTSYAFPREFKNIDETKSFEGHFLSLKDGVMTFLNKNGIENKVPIEKLSLFDQSWVKAAAIVTEKSKKDAAFRVLFISKNGDVLVRMSLSANKITNYRDPYIGEFLLIDGKSKNSNELGVSETYVRSLYWGETKQIEMETWKYWYYEYYNTYPVLTNKMVLGNYFFTLESAVERCLKNNSEQKKIPETIK